MDDPLLEPLQEYNEYLSKRWRLILRVEANSLKNWMAAVITAAPLTMLWMDGIVRVGGVLYLVCYGIIMVVSGAMLLLVIYDGFRLMVYRDPVFSPLFMAIAIKGEIQKRRRWPTMSRADRFGEELAEFLVLANPLTNLTREIMILATRVNPKGITQMRKEAEKQVQWLDKKFDAMPVRTVATESRVWPRDTAEHMIPAGV